MSDKTAIIVCRECAGTGNARGGIYQCDICLGQGHLLCDRLPDGSLPDQEREWLGAKLGPVPYNPWVPYARPTR